MSEDDKFELVLWLAVFAGGAAFCVSSVVVGFVAGGLAGPLLIGSLGGHGGSADLLYALLGAFVALLGAVSFVTYNIFKGSLARQYFMALVMGGMAVAALVLVSWADAHGYW